MKSVLVEYAIVAAMVFGLAAMVVHLVRKKDAGPEITTGPDGKPALLISCRGSADCIRDAAKSCPRGYSLVSQQQEKGSQTVFVGGGDAPLVPLTSQTWEGSMLIRCRAQKEQP
jgi:hypothetical protein